MDQDSYLFEITTSVFDNTVGLRCGSHVEGLGIVRHPNEEASIIVRNLSPEQDCPEYGFDGDPGWYFQKNEIWPLTPAAVRMYKDWL